MMTNPNPLSQEKSKKGFTVVAFSAVPFLGAFRHEGFWWVKFSNFTARRENKISKTCSREFKGATFVGVKFIN